MKKNLILLIAVILLGTIYNGCERNKKSSENDKSEVVTESRESHARDYTGWENQEEGISYRFDYKYDKEKNGVRLILSYDKEKSRFVGSVENVTNKTIKNVRVEIHLSNGKELGPTAPTDLKSGEKIEIQLDAKGEIFEKWSAHAEVGSGESEHELDRHEKHEDSEHGDEQGH